jgi:hypothetical protein
VPAHELLELLLGVLAPRIGLEHGVEVGEHVLDPLQVLGARVLERLLHPLELAVEHLAPQQVVDLLVLLASLRAAPGVGLELLHGAGGVAGQRVELHLRHPRAVGRVGEQRRLLELDGFLEQLADLLERSVEPAGLARLALALGHLAPQVVEPTQAVGAAPQQVAQRLPWRLAGQHPLADVVDRLRDVVRRFERVPAAVPGAVPERGPGHGSSPRFSRSSR